MLKVTWKLFPVNAQTCFSLSQIGQGRFLTTVQVFLGGLKF